MDLYDLRLPAPFDTEQEVASPGDIPTVRGEESLRRWVLRCLTTLTGDLLHRPDFGVGAQDEVDRPFIQAATVIANKARRQIRGDRRVRDVRVTAGQSSTNPRLLDVLIEIETVDGSQLGVETRIEIGI